MKRTWFFTVTASLIMWMILVPVQSGAAAAPVQIIINGARVASDVEPIIVKERTMVPVRVVAEYLEKRVDWDVKTQTVIINSDPAASNIIPVRPEPFTYIALLVDGRLVESEPHPYIKNNRTMVPLAIISAEFGMDVNWDEQQRLVTINEKKALPVDTTPAQNPVSDYPSTVVNESTPLALVDPETMILGESKVNAESLKKLLRQNNPLADPELVDLYLEIGKQYGIRGDIAFCQAAKETGWWKFGGLVKPYQNNFCGLSATGAAATGEEDLNGADPGRVKYEKDVHGAVFDTPATGVEAHIQHLYAYACKDPLPAGRTCSILVSLNRPAVVPRDGSIWEVNGQFLAIAKLNSREVLQKRSRPERHTVIVF
ncbi:stalk domain-containing protein [Syntrophomonas palmitatica]|uniref:stalk domain-containing protein n=1 Tax=Syntrophomonas palmitatica TaxID=402877 RepID=UPI0006D298C2|nr:stalk domain-containing protein [Syntrophomonas palmitatica]